LTGTQQGGGLGRFTVHQDESLLDQLGGPTARDAGVQRGQRRVQPPPGVFRGDREVQRFNHGSYCNAGGRGGKRLSPRKSEHAENRQSAGGHSLARRGN